MNDFAREEDFGREEEDNAARAFDAVRDEVGNLRDEVASLRKGIELVYRQGQGAKGVDYSLTLGQITKTLQALQERLAAIEGKPALEMTAEDYWRQVSERRGFVGQSIGSALRPEIDRQQKWATHELQEAARAMKETVGRVRSERDQRTQLYTALGGGVVAGVVLWTVLVAALPWGMGTWLGALPIAGTEWASGLTLMHAASSDAFEKMMTLYNTCGAQSVAFCQEAIAEKTVDSARQAEGASAEVRHKAQP